MIREGLVVSGFEPLDSLSTAFAMLKRCADVTPSVSTSSVRPPQKDKPSDVPDLPELGGPDIFSKLKLAYADLFHCDNDYEEELLLQIRAELAHNDEIDNNIANVDSSQPSAKSNRTIKHAKKTKADTSIKLSFEPPSKFAALAETMATPVSRLSELI